MLSSLMDSYTRWRIDARHRQSLRAIDRHGWTATYVTEDIQNSVPAFAYTIGFSDYGGPELITFDLPPIWCDQVFQDAFERVRRSQALPHGWRYVCPEPDAGGFECVFLTARNSDTWEKFAFDAVAYSELRGRTDRPAIMQIVWPSSDTFLYPWQAGCPDRVTSRQPQLWTFPPHQTGTVV